MHVIHLCNVKINIQIKQALKHIYIHILHFYMPYLFGVLANMALQYSLFGEAFNKCSLSAIPPVRCSAIHSLKLTTYVSCCFPLVLLASVYPVSIKFPEPFFLIMCLRNVKCHLLMLSISVTFVAIVTRNLS